jgi:hypothetical protein
LGVGGTESRIALSREFDLFSIVLILVLIFFLIFFPIFFLILVVIKVGAFLNVLICHFVLIGLRLLVVLRIVGEGESLGLLPLILCDFHHFQTSKLFQYGLKGFLQTALLSEHLLCIVGNRHAGVRDQEDARQEAERVVPTDQDRILFFLEPC